MTVVYDAANGVEAHMVVHLLQQAGIEGQIDGEFLQGAMGELPATGNVRVRVGPEDADAARKVISEWEAIQPKENAPSQPETPRQKVNYFIAGVAVAAAVLFFLFRFPGTSEGFDYNDDGTLDEIYYWRGNVTSKVEHDRNWDGAIDLRWLYNLNGVVDSMEADNDFNGTFEQISKYRDGNPVVDETDSNGDGKVDLVHYYEYGVLIETQLFDPITNRPRKKNKYLLGKLVESEMDIDGDGSYDVRTHYDELEQPINESAL